MNKRLIGLGLVICLVLTLGMVSGVSAAGTAGMVIEPTPQTASVCQNFTVNITVTISGGAGVNSAGAHLDFDTTYLEVVSITPGAALTNVLTSAYNNTAGTIDYDAGIPMGSPGVTTDFVLATVKFHALATTGGTPLTFVFAPVLRKTAVYEGFENILDPGAAIDGNVIICQATLGGHVDLQGRPDAPDASWITDLTVTFLGDGAVVAITDNVGNFTILDVVAGIYDICVKSSHALSELAAGVEMIACQTTLVDFGTLREGDADNNDVITLADYAALYVAYGSEPGDGNWDPNCDFNQNDAVELQDYALLYANYGETGDCYVED
jgi:hypothetical protein